MIKCKICNEQFKRLGGHVAAIHNLTVLEYTQQYLISFNIIDEYKRGLSAPQICKKIREETNNDIKSLKGMIYEYLKKNNIERRGTSEAIKCWSAEVGGPWNKGETKESHPSVLLYANSRTGKDNPYYNTPIEKRIDGYYSRISEDEVQILRRRIGGTLKQMWINGDIKPIKETDPDRWQINLKKMHDGYNKWKDSLESIITFPRSKMEIKIGKFLENIGFVFTPQFPLKSIGVFDYGSADMKLIIEYHGTYWHCDPRVYKPDFYHTIKKKTAKELWQKDAVRKSGAESLGYTVLAFWEADLRKLTDGQIEEILSNEIVSYLKNRKS